MSKYARRRAAQLTTALKRLKDLEVMARDIDTQRRALIEENQSLHAELRMLRALIKFYMENLS